jgi:histidine phosphotransferase ChpT
MDMRIAELMCSRLCHDLVSPVGAIRNGLELLEDTEDGDVSGFGGEAVRLIDHSAQQADRRLRLFRLAYGQAGRQLKSFDDVRVVAAAWFEGGRTRLDWPADQPQASLIARLGLAKTVLNLVVLAEEALPVGGAVSLTSAGSPGAGSVTVLAEGRNARLTPDMQVAMVGPEDVDVLTARTVHAYATARFAEGFGLALSFATEAEGRVVFRLAW